MTLKARLIAYNNWQAADQAAYLARRSASAPRHASAAAAAWRTPRRRARPSVMAERIARAAESSVRPPSSHGGAVCHSACCEHCIRWLFAQGIAAMARRLGGVL